MPVKPQLGNKFKKNSIDFEYILCINALSTLHYITFKCVTQKLRPFLYHNICFVERKYFFKMKILMIAYEFPPLGGGSANKVYYTLKEFSKIKDLNIDLITSSVNKFKIEKFSENITIHYMNIRKNKNQLHYQTNKDLLVYSFKTFIYIKKLMRTKIFDLIHAYFGIPCGYIAMKLGLPFIVSLQGSDVPFFNNRFNILDRLFFRNLSKKIWKKARTIIANSQGLKDLALEVNSGQHIDVIYNGVDIEEFKFSKNKKINKKIILLSIGRLIERKGFEYLIKALKNADEIKTIIIGDGYLKSHLEQLSKKLQLNIEFLGFKNHNEIKNYLQKADIFVLPSLNEGMSNAVLEAMACGLPLIITDVGGSRELVKSNGFIVKKKSSEEINKVLKKYLSNRNLIQEHGKQSRILAESMPWNKIAAKYLKIYEKLGTACGQEQRD
ncbi:Glycosyltransferase family 4 protein [Candidatus Magnetomoraceae bacterium gMMP-1]